MPNTLNNLQDIRIAQSFLESFRAALQPLKAFSTDFSAEFLERGKTVNVPVIGENLPKSSDFEGSYSKNADRTVNSIAVSCDRHKVRSFHLTDIESAESSFIRLERLANSEAKQMAQDVLQDIFSVVTQANYGAAALEETAASDFDADSVLGVRAACAQAKMPTTERSLILDDAYYTALLGDQRVSHSYLTQMSQPALMEARIPRIYGFDIYDTIVLPENDEKLVGFAAHPAGLAVAMRYLAPLRPEAYLESGPITDPETGITFGYRRFYDTDSGKEIVAFECLYGFKPAIKNGIKRIVGVDPATS
jgi:hypothetical protein